MARAGRKRKNVVTHLNGPPRRGTTQAELNALNLRQQQKVMALALTQPHRRGRTNAGHPWLACALGRLCLAQRCPTHLYVAGETYASLVHRWRAAKGVPRHGPAGEGAVSIDGPPEARVRAWEATICRVERALESAQRGLNARMRKLLLDDCDLPPEQGAGIVQGLEIIARHVEQWGA
ncbi:hypothetical protein [Methylovirgula sp. 4M-Z18]|uniref:hypothetical protein n=1 Tax=Methylovirgula sp. 4M-Z18 TaxID=2293567 RepID=UPI000E2EABF0|nr:hypothetical protein [Methylovirgula sp. 4M-Z18]RFB79993.1 hypothetical protein DYH55_00105 [Methylovirgula sp. 4M-Z18]